MNQKELKELIEFLIEKDIAEFELERGDVKVKIKRGGQTTVVHAHGEMPYPVFGQGGSRGSKTGAAHTAASSWAAGSRRTRGSRKSPYRQIADCWDALRGTLAGSSAIRQGWGHGGDWTGSVHCGSDEAAE